MREIHLGRLAGLTLTALPSAILGSLGLWAVLAALGVAWLRLTLAEAILGGFAGMLIHWFGVTAQAAVQNRALRPRSPPSGSGI